jgi:hypothetical protein
LQGETVRRDAVSEMVGVILLIAVAVGAMALVILALIAGPLPTSVPSFSGLITIGNNSHTIYISHEGGDSLFRGQYQILLDGVDRTSSFGSNSPEPWSMGKVLNYTPTTMPNRVVVVFNTSGGGGTILLSVDLINSIVIYPGGGGSTKLTVTKIVVNDDGGTKQVSDFTLKVDGYVVTSGVQYGFNAGAHTVSETSDSGYAETISGDCASDGSITLNPGDVKSCTITNNDIQSNQPKLTVTKIVVNDDDGTKQVSDFPLWVDGTGVTSGVQYGFNAGAYTVSETSDSGYTETISGDCASDGSITLNPGDVKSCTITNDDIGGGGGGVCTIG